MKDSEVKEQRNFVPLICLLGLIITNITTFIFGVIYRSGFESQVIFWLYFLSFFLCVEMFVFHLSPAVIHLFLIIFCRRHYKYDAWWFQLREWEKIVFKKCRVKDWKMKIIAYDRNLYSTQKLTVDEVIENMTSSELVHELLCFICYLPMFLYKYLGHWPVMLVLCIVSSAMNFPYIMIQRYNRQRVLKIRDIIVKRENEV